MKTSMHLDIDEKIAAILDEEPLRAGELAARVAKKTGIRVKEVAARIQHLLLANVLRVTDWDDCLELVPELECTVCHCTQERACPSGCSWAHRAGEVPLCSECDGLEQEIATHLREAFPLPETRAELLKRFGDHDQVEGNEALFGRALGHAVVRGLLISPAELEPFTVPEKPAAKRQKKPARRATAGARS
jgi:hypothetical protein